MGSGKRRVCEVGERGSLRLSQSASLGHCDLETLRPGFQFHFICMSQTNGGRREGQLSPGHDSLLKHVTTEVGRSREGLPSSGKNDVVSTGRPDLGDRSRPCCSRDWMESSRGGDSPAQRDSCKAPAQVQEDTGEKQAEFGGADGGTPTVPGLGWPLALRAESFSFLSMVPWKRRVPGEAGDTGRGHVSRGPPPPGVGRGRRGLPLPTSLRLQLASAMPP